jgi:hypothetical protein
LLPPSRRQLAIGALLVILGWPVADSQAEPLAKGSRVLGIQVNEAEDRDYPYAFAVAKTLGMEAVSLSVNWDTIETSPSVFALEPNYLAIVNAFLPGTGVKLDLFVRPLDTNGFHLPRDLRDQPIDDPRVIDRFVGCMGWIFSQLPKVQLNFLGIGNEVDLGLGKNFGGYLRYARFLQAVRSRLKAQRPTLDIGASATLDGLVDRAKEGMREINRYADLVIVTYYPLQPGDGVKDPSAVSADFRHLADTYPGRTIAFSEAGYPSSSILNSSEQKQSEFVRELFKAWDAHASQVRQITLYHLTDSGPDAIAEFTRYYGISAAPFKAFLSCLGLRTFAGSGRDKEAFGVVRREARARGW